MIHYGLRNCHYKLPNAAPVKMPGAVKLTLNGDVSIVTKPVRTPFGWVDYPVEVDDKGYSASLEIAALPKSFLMDVLNYAQNDNGVMTENVQKIVHFSLLFETRFGSDIVRKCFTNCVCRKPDFDVTTMVETPTVDTRKLDLKIYPDLLTGAIGRSISKFENEDVFSDWFNGVY